MSCDINIAPEKRNEWRKTGDERMLRLLDALERAELLRDSATAVVENEQGRAAMYIGKYEEALREKEKVERTLETAVRERDWLADRLADIAGNGAGACAAQNRDARWWLAHARQAAGGEEP